MPIDSDPHPVVPDKVCAKCGGGPVTIGTVTTYVTYYICTVCGHVWSEQLPTHKIPISDW